MTVANTTVKQTYVGDGINLTFAIPHAFILGEASTVTKVTLISAGGVETLQVEGPDYALDPVGDNPVNVIMVVAPLGTETLRVERVSPRTQGEDLNSGGPNTPYPPETIENQLDRLVYHVQELGQEIDDVAVAPAATPSSAVIPDWAAATEYLEDQVVIDKDTPTNKMYRALSDHTSAGIFNTDLVGGKWEIVPTTGLKGDTGDAGANGAVGPQGIQGLTGGPGADGADGIFSAIASEVEARAGVENTKGMTALRTAQAIDEQVVTNTDFVALEARVTVNEADIQDLKNRVSNLEAVVPNSTGRFSGSQKLVNNQAAPLELLGGFNPSPSDGRGAKFLRDGDGTEYAEVMVMIRRTDDLTRRFSTFVLIMQYIDDTWFIGRKDTYDLDQTLVLDGLTLSVATNLGTKEGQLSYITDDMGGDDATHFANSEIKWLGQEIPIGV